MSTYFLLLNGLLLLLASASPDAHAGVAKSGEDAGSGLTTITAKKMTVRNQDGQAVFEGSVVLTKGTLIVYSDKMTVLFHGNSDAPKAAAEGREPAKQASSPKGSDAMPAVSNRSMSQIEATGRVKIVKESGNATCGKAVYKADEEIITLTENPVAWEKGTRVSGKKITMYLKEDRSVVEGGSHLRMEEEEKSSP